MRNSLGFDSWRTIDACNQQARSQSLHKAIQITRVNTSDIKITFWQTPVKIAVKQMFENNGPAFVVTTKIII